MAFVGEAILSALFETLFDKLASSDLLKFARQEQVHAELKKWEKILLKIHAVLDDAEEKQMTDRLVKIWLAELRDLAYDVEDILDEFATEALRRKLTAETEPSTSMVRSLIPSCCTSSNPSTLKFNVKMGSKIEEITARLQDISALKNDLHLSENSRGRSYTIRSRLPTTSLVDESRVYGRETDKEAILNMLLNDEPTDDEVCVIPIAGAPGSEVIITTRNKGVSSVTGTGSAYPLQELILSGLRYGTAGNSNQSQRRCCTAILLLNICPFPIIQT